MLESDSWYQFPTCPLTKALSLFPRPRPGMLQAASWAFCKRSFSLPLFPFRSPPGKNHEDPEPFLPVFGAGAYVSCGSWLSCEVFRPGIAGFSSAPLACSFVAPKRKCKVDKQRGSGAWSAALALRLWAWGEPREPSSGAGKHSIWERGLSQKEGKCQQLPPGAGMSAFPRVG